ncbi:MGH1-like glycoside hydrolase domain-containing protein [Olivibacter sitiensis]|uniref:alpha-L-rhamnosidase-related protein n=1 Tax=Olivibacter sitiensis TaxID=376470 RepID=UPI000426262A|nr:glycogen debranching protein [Olivibacter sitiensis]
MIYAAGDYRIYHDRVIQGAFEAKANSAKEIVSNYHSLAAGYQSPNIVFKFSINGQDNEMPSGQDHNIVLLPGKQYEIPLITFGKQYNDETEVPENVFLSDDEHFRVRLDMRPVFKEWEEQGFFTTYSGRKIYKEDFNGVYIAGNTAPLIWDFDNLVGHEELKLHDDDGDHIYEIDLRLKQQPLREGERRWELKADISELPAYESNYVLHNALYNLSLEEMLRDIEDDGTFRTGKEWGGVWTRDVSYSIILAIASIKPDVAKASLLRKVRNKRIIQDTGTGGSYPVSTDRVIWAVAAWELYLVTGDRQWLEDSYDIIKNSIDDDKVNAYNRQTGLVKGESSFLDWREQSYPRWMQSVDIYQSENLGTNMVHYQANKVLSHMARLLGRTEEGAVYANQAEAIKEGVNKHLWLADKGYFSQYLYGRTYLSKSVKSETLGEALSILFDVADEEQTASIMRYVPSVAYGTPCFFPQIALIPPYHNDAIWPFVQAYWGLAAAKAGHETNVLASIAAIMRPAALFLTNKENFSAKNGDYSLTQVNSDEMLWSLSGNLAMVYKVLFGMQFQEDGLAFSPFVPKALRGERILSGFPYRNATLNITLNGYGNKIKSISLDGKSLEEALVPANIQGEHELEIVLSDTEFDETNVNLLEDLTSPATPMVRYENGRIQWSPVEGAESYKVLKNGKISTIVKDFQVPITQTDYAEYQVIAVSQQGLESFASAPYVVYSKGLEIVKEIEDYAPGRLDANKGYMGKGYVKTSTSENKQIAVPVTIPREGRYVIDIRYANGEGPINTDNKCAIRTLRNGDEFLGTVVMPQRGKDEWSNWGFSNRILVDLPAGEQVFKINYEEPANRNMNIETNEATLDQLRIIRVK